jgi:Glycosyl transferase family 90
MSISFFEKNFRAAYYLAGFSRLFLPSAPELRRLERRLTSLSPAERERLSDRGNYYFRSSQSFDATGGVTIGEFRRQKIHRVKTNYFLDLYHPLRHFDRTLRFHYRFGDKYFIPDQPTFLKARELCEANANGVLMKLNKVRHFCFVGTDQSYESKLDRVVWRGNGKQAQRQALVERYANHPLCDVGQTNDHGDPRYRKPYLTMAEQLKNKFVLSVEGNDVATNLKWIMSSQSLCFMPRPTRETWFMEGRLIPDHHYVQVKPDFSDLEEKLRECIAEPDRCRAMIANANDYVRQFFDEEMESLISVYVVDKYFALSGQTPRLGIYPMNGN